MDSVIVTYFPPTDRESMFKRWLSDELRAEIMRPLPPEFVQPENSNYSSARIDQEHFERQLRSWMRSW